ncbi:NUDIX hydrolase [Actinosynnema sp. NPDC020468]|uniref:NUDIX hydrolase n=1 Tax=Actinosynnema sp. NPDC020468 TaxID=3154488 RepID=UPI0033C62BF4
MTLEGPPESEFEPGIAGRLPRKPVAAGVLVRDEAGQVLFVVPRYKPVLDIPGGIVEADESPKAACAREVLEELGLELPVGRLLVVDWLPRKGVWSDSHQFVFDGGVLTADRVAALGPHDAELDGLKFLALPAATGHVYPSLHRRLELAFQALESNRTIYAEFGREV